MKCVWSGACTGNGQTIFSKNRFEKTMKNLLGCTVIGAGLAAAAWWISRVRREEKIFRELLRGLTVGPNPEEVLHRIAERSARLVGGTAAYVERLDAERD